MKTKKDIENRLKLVKQRLRDLDTNPNWECGKGEWRANKKYIEAIEWVLEIN